MYKISQLQFHNWQSCCCTRQPMHTTHFVGCKCRPMKFKHHVKHDRASLFSSSVIRNVIAKLVLSGHFQNLMIIFLLQDGKIFIKFLSPLIFEIKLLIFLFSLRKVMTPLLKRPIPQILNVFDFSIYTILHTDTFPVSSSNWVDIF